MRIGVDITFLFDQYAHRGIGTYARELLGEMLQNREHTWVLFGFKNLNANLAELGIRKGKYLEFVSFGRPRNSNPLNWLIFKFFYKPKIRAAKLDVYFAPHFERGLPVDIVPTTVMMHDIIPFVTKKYSARSGIFNFLKGIFYRHNLNSARKAQLVLTNSDFSKRELVNKTGFAEEKVTRIHLGISDTFRSKNISIENRDLRRVLIIYKITTPYLLYYGGLEANKNVPNLLLAFNTILSRFPDLKLVIAGKEFKVGWDNKPKAQSRQAAAILEQIADLKLKHSVIITGEIEQNHLPIVMKGAAAFVHLSTYEGFGFSVLEAAAAGVPVIASRRSSYPEILQEAPAYVNPDDSEKVAQAILSVMQDEKLKAQMVRTGLEVSEQFSWKTTAELTLQSLVKVGSTVIPFKITYVLPYFFPVKGGAERNCYELARRMADMGHTVTVLTSSDSKLSGQPDFPFKVERFRRLNHAYYLGFYPGLFTRLMFSRQDIVHVHGFGFIWQDFCLLFKKFWSRTKMINTPHGPFMALPNYSLPAKLLRFVYTLKQKLFLRRLYNGVIEVNPSQAVWIKKYGFNDKKIHYLPNGISESIFTQTDTTGVIKQFTLRNKFLITFIGRYEKYKGLDTLINAVAELYKSNKTVRVIAMGEEGKYLDELQQMVRDLKLEKIVTLLVAPEDELKEELLSVSDLFVVGSQWEAFGIAMLEAMAKENAIITTRTEGGAFLIKEEENGFFYDYGDPVELQSLILKFMEDKTLLKKVQATNTEKAKRFSWDKISQDYYQILKRIIK
jgi:glycosyltransferase involved in cell wall biosynthesis